MGSGYFLDALFTCFYLPNLDHLGALRALFYGYMRNFSMAAVVLSAVHISQEIIGKLMSSIVMPDET